MLSPRKQFPMAVYVLESQDPQRMEPHQSFEC